MRYEIMTGRDALHARVYYANVVDDAGEIVHEGIAEATTVCGLYATLRSLGGPIDLPPEPDA